MVKSLELRRVAWELAPGVAFRFPCMARRGQSARSSAAPVAPLPAGWPSAGALPTEV